MLGFIKITIGFSARNGNFAKRGTRQLWASSSRPPWTQCTIIYTYWIWHKCIARRKRTCCLCNFGSALLSISSNSFSLAISTEAISASASLQVAGDQTLAQLAAFKGWAGLASWVCTTVFCVGYGDCGLMMYWGIHLKRHQSSVSKHSSVCACLALWPD